MSQPSVSFADQSRPAERIPGIDYHPGSLYVLFATEMWERFGFYTVAAVMTLFLQDKVQGFGWTKDQATLLWSNYLMFVYLTPFLGGLIADKYLGYRRSILIGGTFFVAGYLLLAMGSASAFYAALVLLFVGNGFFKPNISTIVGNFYPAGSPLRDSAYNIFYMGINVGAFMAPIVAEILQKKYGFRSTFYAAAAGMGLGTVLFAAFYRYLYRGERPSFDPSAQPIELAEDIPPKHENAASMAINNVPERNRIAALLVIYGIVIVFWMVFHQNGSTMTYWANDNTDWKASTVTPILIRIFTLGLIDGSDVSGVISNAINPFWVVILSIPLVRFWKWLNVRGLEPSTPAKIGIGMLLTCLAFLILFVGAKSGGDQNFLTVEQAEARRVILAEEAAKYPERKTVVHQVIPDQEGKYAVDENGEYWAVQNKVSPWWIIGAYGVISLGELMLSPMGLSLVSKVAPPHMKGLMMGGWFAATAIGNKLTMIGLLWTKWPHSTFWFLLAMMALGMAIVLFILLRPLKRAMPGV